MSVCEKASLECYSCGYFVHGEEPAIVTMGNDCKDRTYLKEEAVQAYPDGWTCVDCGDEYSEKNTDVEDFYVINTSEGTLCKKCNQGEKANG